MPEKKEPKLPVEHFETVIHQNHAAIYVRVIVRDADGQLWASVRGSSFFFDLKPVTGEQVIRWKINPKSE